MKCPKCLSEYQAGDKFCRECGAKLPSLCPNCGHEVSPKDKFCPECGEKLAGISAVAQEKTIPKLEDMQKQLGERIPQSLAERLFAGARQMQGEYRLVTALFADVSGSSIMARNMPLEQYVETMNNCFKMMVDIISIKYEGSINRFIGDCVLAFFGAPITYENDAERAILAALDIRDEVNKLNLNVSIGINTGMTYAGEMGSNLIYSERSAWGPDVDFAKRLQESAGPGEIYIGSSTYRLTRKAFEFSDPIDIDVKGMDTKQRAYPVLKVSEHPEKLRGIEGLRAKMIGRDHEFSELKEATDEWLSGHGQIVSVIGEAGIGKSRLVAELRRYLAGKNTPNPSQEVSLTDSPLEKDETVSSSSFPSHPSSLLEGRCVSIGQPISYLPFIDILRTYFNLSEGDDSATIAHKVTEAIQELFPQSAEEALPFIGNLLSIKFGNELDERIKFASPEQIRHQTLMQLRDLFRTLAERKPLLLILEDLHWSDDLSLDLVSLLMDELLHTPLMLLCVYRPEKDCRAMHIGDQARRKIPDRYTELMLNPLSRTQSRQLVENLLTIENLPDSAKEMILQKSEGNPFFIEEVIRSLMEQGMVYREGDHWKAKEEISSIDVPDTIQSVILSRVDRLQEEARYVLQCASVIGRLFRYRLLDHLTQHERKLNDYLDEFENRELIHEERTVPELEYAFRHAFTQEATYQGILKQKRNEFHHNIAKGIEILYQERIDEYYAELAYHYSQSDDAEKAIEYLLKAGEKGRRNYASETSISHFQEVLGLLEHHKIDNKEWKLRALHGMGEVYIATGKAAEAEKAFERAIALAKELNLLPRQLVRLYDRISEAIYWQARYHEIIQYGEMGLEILGDDSKCIEAALMNTRISVGNGNLGNTKKRWEYDHKNMEFISNLPYSAELAYPYTLIMESAFWLDRDFESAMKWTEELEKKAKQHNDLSATALAWHYYGDFLKDIGDYKGAIYQYSRSIPAFESIGDDRYLSWGHWEMGHLLFALGEIDKAKIHYGTWLKIKERMGNQREIGYANEALGNVSVCQHLWDDAITYYKKYAEAFRIVKNPGEVTKSYLHIGNTYLRKGEYNQAIHYIEAGLNEAMSVPPELRDNVWLAGLIFRALSYMEESYKFLGTQDKFIDSCISFEGIYADILDVLPFQHWYLKLEEPSKKFTNPIFKDDFQQGKIDPTWVWIDKFNDCLYNPAIPGGLEIHAVNGRGLHLLRGVNASAPRLMREFSGDFAVETCISSCDEKPQIGGLLVWKDINNFLKFEKGFRGTGAICTEGILEGKWHFIGRGAMSGSRSEKVYLRMERYNDRFSSFCSSDGEKWMSCGHVDFAADGPVQIGIFASSIIDRTIYCGEYKEGTATLFHNFRIWTE